MTNLRISSRLISVAQVARTSLVITIGLGFIGGLVTVGQSSLVSRIVTAIFLEGEAASHLLAQFLSCLVLIGLRAILTWTGEYSAFHAALRIKHALREQLYAHLLDIGPSILADSEDDEGRTGELVNTAMQGIEVLEAYYSQYLPQLTLSALVPLTILTVITPIDPLTAIILLLTAPLLPIFMYLIGSAAKIQTRRQWLGLSRMSAYFLDVFQGLTTLKALGRSREQAALVDQVSENHRLATMRVLRVTFLSALALELIATLSTAVVAVEIGLRLLNGRLAFEQAFFILLLTPEFYLPLRTLGLRFHASISGIEAAKRIFEILDTPTPSKQSANPTTEITRALQDDIPPTIKFNNVSFTYSDGRVGLFDTTFEIPAGQVTVIAGESGAGKSTVLSLLLGFFESQSGVIEVNGIPLNEFQQQSWTRHLAWLPQQPYLFNDSLAANISLARPVANLSDVHDAARLAHADEFIQAFPDTYNTQIGERGVHLSAGQAQRVALARAFLKNAPLLLLDEPGAHLDPETEALTLDSLNMLVQGRTVLIVCHRPPTYIHADQVIWLEEGRVQRIEHPDAQHIDSVNKLTSIRPFAQTDSPVSAAKINPEVKPSNQLAPVTKLTHLVRLLRLAAPYFGRALASVALGSLTIGSSMGLMSTSAYLISRAALQPSIADLQVAIVGVRFFGLSRGVFRYLERLVTHDVTFRLLGKWRGWFFRAIEPLVPARTQHHHSGDLLQRSIGDISSLEDFYVRAIAPPLTAALTGFAACLLLVKFSPVLSVFLSGMLMLSGIGLPVLVLALSRQVGPDTIKQRAALNSTLVDGIQGMADILASGQRQHYQDKVLEQSHSLGIIQARIAYIHGFQTAASRLLADLAMLGVLWLGAIQINQGIFNGVILGALTLLASSCFEAFLPLTQAAQHLSGSLAAAGRLFEIVDTHPEVSEPLKPIPIPAKFDLKVARLSFSYPELERDISQETLAQISFSLTPARKIALVGTSGSGKSTILSLLLRFWEVQDGEILLNGRPLNQYSGDELRKKIAVLPQNSSLFSATIWDNLRLAQPQASRAEIEQVARSACLHDWILTLPDGYQTWVGEGGIKLSGGQRQRISVARALLRPATLFLLDEPTSHLDPTTEYDVIQGILEAVNQNSASLLLITHRLIGMGKMDEILVMENGRIFERGKHQELVLSAGLYARMWNLQQQSA